ncbi:MAG: hypothetical protein NXH82_15035 [Rhodobacteraceae bacterium]|nr:hypothetical protein [Paracoccaceae bacterium]
MPEAVALRRRATVALHWLGMVPIALVAAADAPGAVLLWALAGTSGGMVALALVFGLLGGPSPALSGALRHVHLWSHRGLYALLGWIAVAAAARALGLALPGPGVADLCFAAVGAGMLHGVFNLWRHTSLGDGALRRMMPRRLHGML